MSIQSNFLHKIEILFIKRDGNSSSYKLHTGVSEIFIIKEQFGSVDLKIFLNNLIKFKNMKHEMKLTEEAFSFIELGRQNTRVLIGDIVENVKTE